jgi:hypothetical protein
MSGLGGPPAPAATRSRSDSTSDGYRRGVIRDEQGALRRWWVATTRCTSNTTIAKWGRPVVDDDRLFGKICLQGFQAGLSTRGFGVKASAENRPWPVFAARMRAMPFDRPGAHRVAVMQAAMPLTRGRSPCASVALRFGGRCGDSRGATSRHRKSICDTSVSASSASRGRSIGSQVITAVSDQCRSRTRHIGPQRGVRTQQELNGGRSVRQFHTERNAFSEAAGFQLQFPNKRSYRGCHKRPK